MVPYFFILFIVLLWILLEYRSVGRKAFWIPFVFLVLFGSFRNYTVGTDTEVYVANFIDKIDYDYFKFNENIEIGYQFFEYSLVKITNNYFWLFFVSSIFVIYPYLKVFRNYSENYFISVFLYITFGFYSFYFNGLRQAIAMSILIWGIPYLLNKNNFKFIFIIFVASLFHKSVLILILFYFLVNFRIKFEYKIISVFLFSMFFSGLAVKYLAEINERYTGYAQVSENSGGYMIMGLHVIIGIILYIYYKNFMINDKKFSILLQYYILGLAFLLPVTLLGSNPSGPQRLLLYFSWTIMLLIPTVMCRLKSVEMYIIFYLSLILYFYLRTTSFSGLTPYIVNPMFRIF